VISDEFFWGWMTCLGILLTVELGELARRWFVRYHAHHRVPHRELRTRRSRPSGQVPADRTGKSGDSPKSAAAA
jgi:hypothetical protein